MKFKHSLCLAAPCLAALLLATSAQAQLPGAIQGVLGGDKAAGAATGSAIPDLGSVGSGNIAGVLGYCAQQKYLGGDAASVKDKILGKLGGAQQAEADPGYQEGLSGVLGGNSGSKMDLTGGGLKQQLTEKVCDQVLKYGQSML